MITFSFDHGQNNTDGLSLIRNEMGKPTNISELNEKQELLVSGLLYGYSLREGKWGMCTRVTSYRTSLTKVKIGAFAVDRVAPIEWNRYEILNFMFI